MSSPHPAPQDWRVSGDSPTVRDPDPLVCDIGDKLRRIEINYVREGSGPGSRFEGQLLEDVQARAVIRELRYRWEVES